MRRGDADDCASACTKAIRLLAQRGIIFDLEARRRVVAALNLWKPRQEELTGDG